MEGRREASFALAPKWGSNWSGFFGNPSTVAEDAPPSHVRPHLSNPMGTTQTKLKIDEPELDDPVCVEAEVAAGTAQPEEKEAAPAAHKKAAPAAHKSSVALTQEDRLMDMIEQASLKSPPAIANFLVQAKPWLLPMFSVLVTVLNVVGPLYIKAGTSSSRLLSRLASAYSNFPVGCCMPLHRLVACFRGRPV